MSYESIGTTIFKYFNPTRSPFYPIVAFGTSALVLSCTGIADPLWYFVSVPISLAIFAALAFSFRSQPELSAEEHHEQLIFARSLSISSALLAFAITARATDQDSMAFWVTFSICIIQSVVFYLYILARSRSREPMKMNFVQIALITTALLIGACHSLYEYASNAPVTPAEGTSAPASDSSSTPPDPEAAEHYFRAGAVVIGLWVWCIGFWVRHLVRTLVHIPVDPDLSGTGKSTVDASAAPSTAVPSSG